MSRQRRSHLRMAGRGGLMLMVLALAGCQLNFQAQSLPGGGVSGPTFHMTADFANVLNLPQRANIKLDGVTVGQVTSIAAHDFHAIVGMEVQRSVQLPAGTVAEIRFTTPLGEDYVALVRPATPQPGPELGEGAHLTEASTRSAATVEDTFAAISLFLNGGGLEQVKTIITEVNQAIDGRGPEVRDLIDQVNRLVTALNSRSADIDRALTALASLSAELDKEKSTVASGLQNLTPAIQVLADETADLNNLLAHVAKLGDVTTAAVAQTRDAVLADIRELGPILDAMLSIKGLIGPVLDDLVKFNGAIAKPVPGDYLDLEVTAIVQFAGSSSHLAPGAAPSASAPAGSSAPAAAPENAAAALLSGGLP